MTYSFGAHSYSDGSTTPVMVIPAIHTGTWQGIIELVESSDISHTDESAMLVAAIREGLGDRRTEVELPSGKVFYKRSGEWYHDKYRRRKVDDEHMVELLEERAN